MGYHRLAGYMSQDGGGSKTHVRHPQQVCVPRNARADYNMLSGRCFSLAEVSARFFTIR